MKRFFQGLLVLLLAGGVTLGVAYVWAGTTLPELDQMLRDDIGSERTRAAAVRRPVLRGPARDRNAADTYRPAMDAVATDEDALRRADASILLRRRAEIDAVREAAARDERCDFAWEFEKGAAAQPPSLKGFQALIRLVIHDGNDRAQAGDPPGAAERYLDALRASLDFAMGGGSAQAIVGQAAADDAGAALEKLIATKGVAPGETCAAVAREVEAVQAALPSAGVAARHDRLVALVEIARVGRGDQTALAFAGRPEPAGSPLDLVFGNAVAGRVGAGFSWPAVSRGMRDLEMALGLPDAAARKMKLESLDAEARGAWNPLVFLPAGVSDRAYVRLGELDAKVRARLEDVRARAQSAADSAEEAAKAAGKKAPQ